MLTRYRHLLRYLLTSTLRTENANYSPLKTIRRSATLLTRGSDWRLGGLMQAAFVA